MEGDRKLDEDRESALQERLEAAESYTICASADVYAQGTEPVSSGDGDWLGTEGTNFSTETKSISWGSDCCFSGSLGTEEGILDLLGFEDEDLDLVFDEVEEWVVEDLDLDLESFNWF